MILNIVLDNIHNIMERMYIFKKLIYILLINEIIFCKFFYILYNNCMIFLDVKSIIT